MNIQTEAVSDAAALLARVAERVRVARAARALPRRALAELSGVSPRYLAQLEAGEGNISIALLNRVAGALGLPIEALIAERPPLPADAARVAQLFQVAPPEVKGRVRALLAPQTTNALRAQRICLIGLRGAGKSTLGAAAAQALNLPFIELNKQIEARTGMPLSEVMALYGPDGYRNLEAELLDEVIAENERIIMAVGGGIVGAPDTYARLLQRCHTIWIRTSPGEHMTRVRAQGDMRPMAGNPAAMDQLKALLQARSPMYERASAQVDTAGKPVNSSVNDLLAQIAKHRFLDGPAS
ncbi:MAG: helix-turn-helix transcriptional regulator [Pseudomonadota bacterium]